MKLIALLLLLFVPVVPFVGGQPALSQTVRTQPSGEIGYQMARIRRTKMMFPKLTRFRDRAVLGAVNRQIDVLTRDFGCQDRGRNNYFNLKSRVEYAAKDVFSIYASAEYFCGGAYPTNDSNNSLTFDMKTGKQVKFEELFKDYEADKREILGTIFASQIATATRRAASRKPDAEDDCEDLFQLDRLESSTYAFNFSRNGLSVQPEWPHVIEACAERVTVPYAKLMKFAAPNGVLARVLK
ncbi:MAG TPA: hypothetical protein VF766_01280 [Pyrinomonadaceae bacterium]